ncbi:hypothetical protein [Yersinia intermedia]|uniref:hypothetical protein n=1 Tax=Yersinia intermedia TaxID=631 RepID=UPI0005DDFF44|nr:hypothetical protein [Yersinia intermedia]CNE36000.1 Uncharacterised protein [Yersinia intermedia]
MSKYGELKNRVVKYNAAEDEYWADLDKKISEIKAELMKYLGLEPGTIVMHPSGQSMHPVSVGQYDGEKVINMPIVMIDREDRSKTVDISVAITASGDVISQTYNYSVTFSKNGYEYTCEDACTFGHVICDSSYVNQHVFTNLYESIFNNILSQLDPTHFI